MPIRNVVSTLPDPDYIRALEAELERLRGDIQAIKLQLRGGVK